MISDGMFSSRLTPANPNWLRGCCTGKLQAQSEDHVMVDFFDLAGKAALSDEA